MKSNVEDDNLASVTADPHTALVVGGQTTRLVQWTLVSLQGADEAAAVLVVDHVYRVPVTICNKQSLLAIHHAEAYVEWSWKT